MHQLLNQSFNLCLDNTQHATRNLILFLTLSFSLVLSFLDAQDLGNSFFVVKTDIEMNLSQEVYYNRIIADNSNKDVVLVEFNSPKLVSSEGKISFNIPNFPCLTTFKTKNVDYSNNENYSLYGELLASNDEDPCICGTGDFFLNRNEGEYHVKVTVGETNYRISPLGENLHVLYRREFSEETAQHDCGLESEGHNHIVDEVVETSVSEREGNCPVRLLVLITPNAGAVSPSPIPSLAASMVGELKIALANSRITRQELTIDYVGTAPLTTNFSSTFFEDAFVEIENPSNPIRIEITNLLNSNQADIAVILTGTDDPDLLGRVSRPLTNIAIVESFGQAVEFYSFTHEVGHLFSGGHQEGYPAPAQAKLMEVGNCEVATTVIFAGRHPLRKLYFSNPDVLSPWGKTGEYDRNNAQTIRNTACTVSSYIPGITGNEPLGGYLKHPSYGE